MTLGVLLVEDDPSEAYFYQQALEAAGLSFLGAARDGGESLRLRRVLNPDVVLMNLFLPDRDGIQTAALLNREAPLPVVLITAVADSAFLAGSRDAGVYAYLIKPVQSAALELAHRNFQRLASLEKRVLNLGRELQRRRVLEQAGGILMQRRGLDADRAQRRLEAMAAAENKTPERIAQKIIAGRID